MADNRVKFGLSRCYYSKITENEGTITYATPVAMPGAVNMDFSPSGSVSNFAADNIYNYYTSNGVAGFEGDLEMAYIGNDFKKDILGYLEDTNGAIYEVASPVTSKFALLFQFDGDQKAVRHVLYNCSATRVPLNSQTTADTKEPVTETITITAAPATDTEIVHAYLEQSTATDYTGWFNEVYTVAQ